MICKTVIIYKKLEREYTKILKGDFEKGGLKMIDIESYFIFLKASWVSRLVDSNFRNGN